MAEVEAFVYNGFAGLSGLDIRDEETEAHEFQ